MTVENDQGREQQLNVPFDEGVNVKIAGSNIEFREYPNLLQEAASAISIGRSYFRDPNDSSNVQQAERYVRISKDESGLVHARDGPLARVGHLLESDRHGTRRTEQTDMDGRGEQSPGYRHQVGVDEVWIQEVWPNHALPKQVKHYFAREHKSMASDHPLSHPKVGTIYYPTSGGIRARSSVCHQAIYSNSPRNSTKPYLGSCTMLVSQSQRLGRSSKTPTSMPSYLTASNR
jgi:hypothetical protein